MTPEDNLQQRKVRAPTMNIHHTLKIANLPISDTERYLPIVPVWLQNSKTTKHNHNELPTHAHILIWSVYNRAFYIILKVGRDDRTQFRAENQHSR
jgi:hypothetical protein